MVGVHTLKYPLRRPYSFKYFKECLPKFLLALFLDTLTHIYNKNIIFFTMFFTNEISPTISYLIVGAKTLKDARFKIKNVGDC